jgi:hypothetical protein
MAKKYMLCKILAMYFTRKLRTNGSSLKSSCLSVINEAKTTVGDVVILLKDSVKERERTSAAWRPIGVATRYEFFSWWLLWALLPLKKQKQNPSKSNERVC